MATFNISYFENLYTEASNYLVSVGFNPLPKISIALSMRMRGSTLGKASGTWVHGKIVPTRITMNGFFVNSKISEQEIQEVFFHECAHIYCFHYYNEDGHTPLFNRICKVLGATGGKFKQSAEVVAHYMSRREDAAKKFLDKSSFTSRDIHSMRCSFKMIARKYGLPLNMETFDKYVRPRYIHIFTSEQIAQAAVKIVS